MLGISLNGEESYEFDPEGLFGIRRSLRCVPRWLVFIERRDKPGHEFARMPWQEAARRLGSAQERLPPELSGLRDIQRETIRNLVSRGCWLLRHGDHPESISHVLARFCSRSKSEVRAPPDTTRRPLFVRQGPDLTKRLTPTPLAADLGAGQRRSTGNQ